MNKKLILSILGAGLLATVVFAASAKMNFAPGARTLMLAHNAYPDDNGKFGDRLDRAIASGAPFAVEEDLVWVDGRSLLIHNAKFASADSPTLESYFFPKVKPIIEKAMKDGDKGNWPLVTLYLDIKNDPIEHLEVIGKVLDKYEGWLTTAVKTNDITKMSPLDVKPMLVILEDKKDDIKQQFFYDRVPVGGKIRAFGGPVKFDDNPKKFAKTEKAARLALMPTIAPESLVTKRADNWRRWFGTDWAFIELCGAEHGNDWNATAEARVKKFVEYGHSLGYLVGFYSINGFTEKENQGWTAEFNFGSQKAAAIRVKAAVKAGADFIATDQYVEVTKLIHQTKH